jgi:hypothetical protein
VNISSGNRENGNFVHRASDLHEPRVTKGEDDRERHALHFDCLILRETPVTVRDWNRLPAFEDLKKRVELKMVKRERGEKKKDGTEH